MRIRIINLTFIILFLTGTLTLFLFARRQHGRVSAMENRYYANPPRWQREDGTWNDRFFLDFDDWISDNIRLRTVMVEQNAYIQHTLFGRITKRDERANAEGELFYVTEADIRSFQHTDLLTDEERSQFERGLQRLNNDLEKQGTKLYYMLCYGKQTIYPERFVEGVQQVNTVSVSEQIKEAVLTGTTVPWVPVDEVLIKEHDRTNLYYRVLDPAHWNEIGSFLGFHSLIETIRQDFPQVTEIVLDDYTYTEKESFREIYGMVYPVPEVEPVVSLDNPKAEEVQLETFDGTLYDRMNYNEHTHFFINPQAGNELKILIIGDSYQRMDIKNYVAEHFAQTLSVDSTNIYLAREIAAIYQPDILVIENVNSDTAIRLLIDGLI